MYTLRYRPYELSYESSYALSYESSYESSYEISYESSYESSYELLGRFPLFLALYQVSGTLLHFSQICNPPPRSVSRSALALTSRAGARVWARHRPRAQRVLHVYCVPGECVSAPLC